MDRPWMPRGMARRPSKRSPSLGRGARRPQPKARWTPPLCKSIIATSSPKANEGVTIIDQHALHERILYEQLRERILSGAIETQSLLVPEPVDLSRAETSAALEHGDLLAELGVKIEPFGGNTLLVAGYPAMLANMSPTDVLGAARAACPEASSPTGATCWTNFCIQSPARRRSRRAIGWRRRRLPRCWSSGISWPTPIIVPTAARRRWFSRGKSSIGNSSGSSSRRLCFSITIRLTENASIETIDSAKDTAGHGPAIPLRRLLRAHCRRCDDLLRLPYVSSSRKVASTAALSLCGFSNRHLARDTTLASSGGLTRLATSLYTNCGVFVQRNDAAEP